MHVPDPSVGPKKLTILFTTDEHGALRPAPRLQKAVDSLKAQEPNRCLLVSGGDVFQGAPESEMDHGKPALNLIRAAGYDVVGLGNHDFDYGQTFLRDWTSKASYPILSANVKDENDQLLPGVQPSLLKEMDGYKVGFVAVTTQETPKLSLAGNMKGLTFADPIPLVRSEVEHLRQQGADVIALIAHTEPHEEDAITAQVPGIDFVLAGHTHEVYLEPRMSNGVPVYRSGSSREAMGKLTVELNPETNKPGAQQWEIIAAKSQEEAHGPVQELVSDQLKAFTKTMGVLHSYSEGGVWANHLAEGDVMDSMMAAAIAREGGTKIGFLNQKNVRGEILPGFVSAGDRDRVFPFPNHVQRVDVTRDELLKAVQLSEERGDQTSLFFHGLDIVRDKDGKACGLKDEHGAPLPPRLQVSTTDFIAGGGLGYFSQPKAGPTFQRLSSVLVEALDEERWKDLARSSAFGGHTPSAFDSL